MTCCLSRNAIADRYWRIPQGVQHDDQQPERNRKPCGHLLVRMTDSGVGNACRQHHGENHQDGNGANVDEHLRRRQKRRLQQNEDSRNSKKREDEEYG